jgi:hypothetical protein
MIAKALLQLSPNGIIYKTFTGVDFGLYETRAVTDEVLDDLDALHQAPCIFQ